MGGESTAEEFLANGLPRADESRKASSNRRGALPLPWRRVYLYVIKRKYFYISIRVAPRICLFVPSIERYSGLFVFLQRRKDYVCIIPAMA